MTHLPPPGWYPDPAVPGAQRYFDGAIWTEHFVSPRSSSPPQGHYGAHEYTGQPYYPWTQARQWKGQAYGLPAFGPGSLATPGRRLGARALDALVLAPVIVVLDVVFAYGLAPRGTLVIQKANGAATFAAFWHFELVALAAALTSGLLWVLYEAVMTVTWGRTLGKMWLGIRPLQTNRMPLGWGRAFGRIALYWLSWLLFPVGLLDPLWCLWDANHQCLHTKAVGTMVVHDPAVVGGPPRDLRSNPAGIPPRSW